MATGFFSGGMKGQGGAAAAVIIIIVIAVIVLFAFPNILGGGFNLFGFGGGAGAVPMGVGPGNAGVVINNFLASPPTIEGGDEANFVLEVENKGGINAESIKYDIFGLGDSNSWSGKSVTINGETELERADPTRNLRGEVTQHEWVSTSKEKNTDIRYPVTARVDYKYRTETNAVLILYSRDDPNIKNTGRTQSTISQVATTAGPLAVVPVGNIPLIGKNTDDFRINFDISNTGGGRPYSGSKDKDLDKIKIKTTGCTLSGDSTVKLIQGKRTISCKIDVKTSIEGPDTRTIELEIEYNYIVESKVDVQVLKSVEQQS